MYRRKLKLEDAKILILNRMTKGAAFMDGDYNKLQEETRREIDEKFSKGSAQAMDFYRDYLWDVSGLKISNNY